MTRYGLYVFLLLIAVGVAWQITSMDDPVPAAKSSGLEVYLGEGCIHCHSQYRRPESFDVEFWGTATDPELEMARQKPVVFGNRRQGPDLSNVGLRRSREWNRIHLMDPGSIRMGSRMPSYAYLFEEGDPRGEALLDYLQNLGIDEGEEWQAHIMNWEPSISLDDGNIESGNRLFQQLCAVCHGESGDGKGSLTDQFFVTPRDLRFPGNWQWIKPDSINRSTELARLIKFGRPGTSMAGTEWLSDEDLADLVRFMETLNHDQPR
jgi:cytochrome c oxidase cbb3-type subunit 2